MSLPIEQLEADLATIRAALKRTAEERDLNSDLLEKANGSMAELIHERNKLRELLRDCPLIRKFNGLSEFIACINSPETAKWQEIVNEEVLKL